MVMENSGLSCFLFSVSFSMGWSLRVSLGLIPSPNLVSHCNVLMDERLKKSVLAFTKVFGEH